MTVVTQQSFIMIPVNDRVSQFSGNILQYDLYLLYVQRAL